MPDRILENIRIATMTPGRPYGLIEDGALAVREGQIGWAGPRGQMPAGWEGAQRIDGEGRLVTPALIDCHTHLVHGGSRAREFELRLQGASYEEIARAGGGILSTVSATRGLTAEELADEALPRLDALIGESAATVEIKSGYGLAVEDELKMLRAARLLAGKRPVRILTTYLAAHAVPPEYKGRSGDYIAEVVLPGMEQAAAEGLVDAVDGFCEGIAFSVEEMARVFEHAKKLGLPVKLHAEQLSNLGGARMAAGFGALSVDHLEYLDATGVLALKQSGTVAVLLPGAWYFIREKQHPPVAELRAAGVPIVLATDCNPGSSPLTSLLLAMNMACTLFRMTPEEALAGLTRNAAKALALQDCGTIEAGKRADLALWNVKDPAELSYRIGFNPLHQRIYAGNFH